MIVLAACIYAIIGTVVGRLVAGHLAWSMYEIAKITFPTRRGGVLTKPDGEQWFRASLLGLVAGALWPACIVLLIRLPAVGAEARGRMRMQQERIQELEEDQRRRERELERELGIGES